MVKVRSVIFWPDTDQVSVEDLEKINVEERYVNAVTTITTKDRKIHTAIVRMISSDDAKLEAEADKISQEIDERLKNRQVSETEKKTRKARQRRQVNTEQATQSQVASAFGEKQKPAPHLAKASKQLAQEKKAADNAFHDAQADVDAQVLLELGPKRRLFEVGEEQVADESEGDAESSGDDVEAVQNDGESDDDAENDVSSQFCPKCQELKGALNQSPTIFLKALNKFASLASPGVQYIDLLPILSNIPKCELSKGHGIYMTVFDKNQIKTHGEGDPKKMTRMGLMALYGRDAMSKNEVTALGTKQGSKGIKKKEREALLAFVNRNKGRAYSSLSQTEFNRVINRKKSQVHRPKVGKKSSPGEQCKKSSKIVHRKSPMKSPEKPVSKSPLKSLERPVRISPLKTTPMFRESPLMMAGVSGGVTAAATTSPNKSREVWQVSPTKDQQCHNDWSQTYNHYGYGYDNTGYNFPGGSSQFHTWYNNA